MVDYNIDNRYNNKNFKKKESDVGMLLTDLQSTNKLHVGMLASGHWLKKQ